MTTADAERLLQIGVVEDNDDLRTTLVEILAGIGHHCTPFGSAEDMEESTASLDLLLVDLNLPGEDGLSLTARLKRAMPRLRVIMMTTRDGVSDRVRGYDVGADIYLPSRWTWGNSSRQSGPSHGRSAPRPAPRIPRPSST